MKVLTRIRRSLADVLYPEGVRRQNEALFLAKRLHVAHDHLRVVGISSDALTLYSLGLDPEPGTHDYPHDLDDLRACQRTFDMMPPHLQRRALPVLNKYQTFVREGRRR